MPAMPGELFSGSGTRSSANLREGFWRATARRGSCSAQVVRRLLLATAIALGAMSAHAQRAFSQGELEFNDCVAVSNAAVGTASDGAGGAFFVNDGVLSMQNCRINQNDATALGSGTPDGGGIYNNGAFMINSGSTISDNSPNDCTGLFCPS